MGVPYFHLPAFFEGPERAVQKSFQGSAYCRDCAKGSSLALEYAPLLARTPPVLAPGVLLVVTPADSCIMKNSYTTVVLIIRPLFEAGPQATSLVIAQ